MVGTRQREAIQDQNTNSVVQNVVVSYYRRVSKTVLRIMRVNKCVMTFFLFYELVKYCAKVDGHFTSTRSSTAEVIWNYEIENVIKLNFKTFMLLEYAHRGPRRRLCVFIIKMIFFKFVSV